MELEQLKNEKEYLLKVKKILEELIKETKKSIDNSKENINEMKRFMWENISDFTDEERALAMNDVDRDVGITNRTIENVEKYEKALNSPYFGKVVFYDDEFDEEQNIYIGISSIQKGYQFYAFDWRAPVSSLFYNFELGKAFYEAPSGTINGNITSKMQFKIEKGNLIRCFNSDINIDDDYLQEILATSSSDKMKNIVSTIQREQNEIIRNDNDKYLIVQGIAGSGKTSVAMHRIAYLLYKDKNLNSKNILIFSPTDVFSNYISNVLPELGEENVLTTTFSEFSKAFLKYGKKIESYTEFLEKIYSNSYNKKIEYKMSEQYYNDIKEFMKKYLENIKFNGTITSNGNEINSKELKTLFIEKYDGFSIKERLDLIGEKVCYSLHLPLKNKKRIVSMLKKNSTIELDCIKIYNKFLQNKNINTYDENTKIINYEDISGLLYIYFAIEGYPYHPYIKHVVIDEAQDYTLFQMEIFKKIFKNSSFTILGDSNQTINNYSDIKSLNNLIKVFEKARYIELSKTYRSSEEIINYSNNILNIDNVCAIRHSNSLPVDVYNVPESLLTTEIEKGIKRMLSMGYNKIAIITKNCDDAIKMYNNIKNKNYQLIDKENINIINQVIFMPSYLAKGLEFDGVIVCNFSDNDYIETERNLFYVVCTRAQHKLEIYNEPKKIVKTKKC